MLLEIIILLLITGLVISPLIYDVFKTNNKKDNTK